MVAGFLVGLLVLGGVGFGCVYDKAFKGLVCIVVVVGGG
jgi:hypothetical protein